MTENSILKGSRNSQNLICS